MNTAHGGVVVAEVVVAVVVVVVAVVVLVFKNASSAATNLIDILQGKHGLKCKIRCLPSSFNTSVFALSKKLIQLTA